MIKKVLTGINLFAFIAVFSQTGIGTGTPEGALDITSPNNEWGLVLPHVDQAENTKNPRGKSVKKGTIVYDLKENCIKYFNGSEWSTCILGSIPFKLECSSAVLNQDIFANGRIAAGTTVSVPFSNPGEAFSYGDITLSSTNVDGLKAVLTSGSIKKGLGSLVFSISGAPSTSGIAKFPLSIGGVQCEFVITVKNFVDITVPALTNFICDRKDQLNYTTLKGKQIINGKEVIVDYSGSNISSFSYRGSDCDAATVDDGIILSPSYDHTVSYDPTSTLIITFSRPVTNVGMTFVGANTGEEFTFITNNSQPIQLKSNSSCQGNVNITGNKLSLIESGSNLSITGGSISVGGVWFTELTIQHKEVQSMTIVGFCLNNSNAL